MTFITIIAVLVKKDRYFIVCWNGDRFFNHIIICLTIQWFASEAEPYVTTAVQSGEQFLFGKCFDVSMGTTSPVLRLFLILLLNGENNFEISLNFTQNQNIFHWMGEKV